jgi:Trk K+ transport system NAD-binding subunit
LIGTATNLIIAGRVLDAMAGGAAGNAKLREISLFDPSWVAAPAALVGLVFLMATSRWLLRSPAPQEAADVAGRRYGAEFVIPDGSPLAGKSLEAAGLAEPVGFEVLELFRADGSSAALEARTRLAAGDMIVMSADVDSLGSLWTMHGLAPLHTMHPMESKRHDHQLVEAAVSPRCRIVGRTVSELPLPDSPYKVTLVAIFRDGQPVEGRIEEVQIEAGDVRCSKWTTPSST